MTLILGILTKRCVAVATDGYSIRTDYNGNRDVEKTNLIKYFPINHNTLLVHHGENVINDKPIEQIIRKLSKSLSGCRNPHELGYRLFAAFDPLLIPMGTHLHKVESGFGLWIVAYKNGPVLHELWWDSTLRFKRELFPLGNVVWGGSGARFAKQVFYRDKFKNCCIRDLSERQAQEFLYELYQEAAKLQGRGQYFGGKYQEVTININGVQ